MSTLILVRLAAEITIKSRRTRSAFIRRLVRNMRDALRSADIEATVEPAWGRVYVRADSPAAVMPLGRVFGISSLSIVDRVVPADVDEIVAAASKAREVHGQKLVTAVIGMGAGGILRLA